jgi:hypothetical protein
MVPKTIDRWQSRPFGERSDPFSLLEEHSVDLHDDCLNARREYRIVYRFAPCDSDESAACECFAGG